jgi:pimeloyl-ACP methyl ester carboxylesterase
VADHYGQGAFRLPDGTAGAVAGGGPPLVLLHGVGLDRHMWQAQVYFFARSHSVVSYDLLGHGESARILKDAALADFVLQLERLRAALGLNRTAIVGFSFGGLVAQAYALRHGSQVEKLVLMSTVYDRSETERAGIEDRLRKARREGPQAIYPAALERWFSPAFLAGQPDQAHELHRRMLDNDVNSFLKAYEIFAFGDRELAGKIDMIACPTLIMTGERDEGSTPAMAWRMGKSIPNSRVSIIPDGRHMMPMEMAQEVNREIARFLVGN